MIDEPLYYAEGNEVRKRPVSTPIVGGGTSITIGFPVCTMSDFVGKEGAEFVAAALSQYETGHRGCMCPHCNPQQEAATHER